MSLHGKRKEIYKYEAPWTVYAMNWSVRPDKRFRLALGSFVEEYNNKVGRAGTQNRAGGEGAPGAPSPGLSPDPRTRDLSVSNPGLRVSHSLLRLILTALLGGGETETRCCEAQHCARRWQVFRSGNGSQSRVYTSKLYGLSLPFSPPPNSAALLQLSMEGGGGENVGTSIGGIGGRALLATRDFR